MHSNGKRIADNSVVRTPDSGESRKFKVWEGKITVKPPPEEGFGAICINVSTGGVS